MAALNTDFFRHLLCSPPAVGATLHIISRPSVCLFVPCSPVNSKWKTVQCSNLDERLSTAVVADRAILRSKVKVTGDEKLFLVHMFAYNVSVAIKRRPE